MPSPATSARNAAERADPPVAVAVVGLGYWGPNILRNLHDLPEADVRYICDIDPVALAEFEHRYPGVETTNEYERIVADPSVEAVALATPVSTHFGLARDALRAGKHVFVEKPLSASAADAIELIDLSVEARVRLMPGHTFLYSPSVGLIRELIRSGEIGDIFFISASRLNLGLHQRDASVAWDLAPHDFSILRYWIDDLPTRISAVSRACVVNEDDVAFINLEFPSGTIANVELSWLAPSKLRRTTIVGSKKMIVYDDTSTEPVRIFDSGVMPKSPDTFGEFQLSYRSGDIISPRIEAVEPLRLEMQDFCAAIRNGHEPRSSWAIGLDVVRMVEAVDRSLACRGAAVSISEADLEASPIHRH